MKKKTFFIAYALVAYCLFLVWTFPADRALRLLQPYSSFLQEKVVLSQINGTIWDGRAGKALVGGVELSNLGWSFQPLALFGGRLQVVLRLQLPEGNAHGEFSLGRGEVALRKFAAQLPASFFDRQIKDFGVGLNGAIAANLAQIVLLDGRILKAEGTVVWSGAQMAEPQKVRLGDLKAQWSTEEDGEILGVLSDGGGPLQAQGTFRLSPADGTYEFSGSFRSRDNSQPALGETLQLFGRPGRDGAVRVNLSGKLPVIGFQRIEEKEQKIDES